MPKKKKTREQKILSDSRRQVDTTPLYSIPTEMSRTQPKRQTTTITHHAQTISTTSYHYLNGDLRKTLLLTGAIVVIELAIRFFSKGV